MRQRAVEKYYSVTQVAFLLSFSEQWVRDNLESFPGSVRIDDDIRIPSSGINHFLDNHTIKAVDQAIAEMGIAARSETELKRKIRGRRKGTS
jgi:hypothetical protein